ncbi:NAD(P)/FAD-dependent oxidoreductase [Flavimaricola marinus]|uniref:N-methyl-L-tryptophan oxidase n=1 Tax=Flavimaricola marinus TaxID=1819565 RepID=A0A238LED5_9RHOB|nr:FAD-binding oxidoreductase [Flavimaricola marinus]SMY07765.1 N-methyl-L-tryptophan oxidase [Flavimaricola marinus]
MIPFPISDASPIAHPGPPPAEADVVIVGGGIVGVMTAWHLARDGVRVVLIEKGRVAGEQSSRNWGWIRAQGRDAAELPIVVEAGALWRDLAETIGEDLGLRQTGVAYLAKDAAEMAGYEAWLPNAVAAGVDSRLLGSAEVAALLPEAARTWAGGLWTATDMRAEPWVAVPALARAAVREGAQIVEGCAVRSLDVEAGRIAGVITEAGRIKAGSVVVAGGAWSSLLLRRHGIALPQLSVRATVVATEPGPEVFSGAAVDGLLAWRRRQDGGFTLAPSGYRELFVGPDAFRHLRKYAQQIYQDPLGTRLWPKAPKGFPDAWGTPRRWDADKPSPFEAMRVLNPAPNHARVTKMLRDFEATFPGHGPARAKAAWAGMIDTMPDVVPVVDRAESLPGLTIATGMSGHGFGIGPAFGRIAAALVQGKEPGHDLSRFRLSRFSDGSKLVLGPSL